MYNVEVLSKFPVVQHFPFGSLFCWDRDANAIEPPTSMHSSSQPTRESAVSVSISSASMRYPVQEGTQAPWASSRMNHPGTIGGIQAPWADGQRISHPTNPRPVDPGSIPVRRAGPPQLLPIQTAANHVRIAPIQPASKAISDTDSNIASTPQPTKAPRAV